MRRAHIASVQSALFIGLAIMSPSASALLPTHPGRPCARSGGTNRRLETRRYLLEAFQSRDSRVGVRKPTTRPETRLPDVSVGTPSLLTTPSLPVPAKRILLAGPMLGGVFSLIIVILLAATDFSISVESLSDLSYNVLDAAFPLTAADVVSVALGEVFAGILGAVASVTSSWLIQKAMKEPDDESSMSPPASAQIVADSEFFVARAGAFPLFSALGLSGSVAALASAAVAFVPYQLTMAILKARTSRQQEEQLMEDLLAKERRKDARRTKSLLDPTRYVTMPQKGKDVVNVELLKPAREIEDALPVEVFADIVKWLGYSVLSTDLSGRVLIDAVPLSAYPGAESAVFGVLLGVTSQIYSDLLYLLGWGGEDRQRKVLQRPITDWAAACLTRSITTATLFGIYETSQIPAKALVSQLLSGGIDGCAGSEDYNLCIEAFLTANPPPVASPEGELRSLVTSLVSTWGRMSSFQ